MSSLFRLPQLSYPSIRHALNLIYPPQCMACRELVESEQGFCGPCWRDASFVHGLACQKCGVAMQGDDVQPVCDDCMRIARPWRAGYAAMKYAGTGRRIVLAFKHGDRTELAGNMAQWIANCMPTPHDDTVIIPVPLHTQRFRKRRYNQAALLAYELAQALNVKTIPDGLLRHRKTEQLDGKTVDARFQTLNNAISANPRYSDQIAGKPVLLIDDVMTSGATLAACTEACVTAGARDVDVAVLARVAKDA